MHCREIVIEIYPGSVPEPWMLKEVRSEFNKSTAAAAKPRRQALLMGLHPRCTAVKLVEGRARTGVPPARCCSSIALLCDRSGTLLTHAGGNHSDRQVVLGWVIRISRYVAAELWSRLQVGCGRVPTIQRTSRTAAGHHDGSHPGGLVHLQRHSIAASRPGDASRSASDCQLPAALHGMTHALYNNTAMWYQR